MAARPCLLQLSKSHMDTLGFAQQLLIVSAFTHALAALPFMLWSASNEGSVPGRHPAQPTTN